MQALQRQSKLAEDAQRFFTDSPTSRTMQALQRQSKLAEDAQRFFTDSPTSRTMQALTNNVRFQGLGPGEDAVHDPMLELPPTGWGDASNGAADATAQMLEILATLVELETWIRLAALLGRLREAGLEGWDAGWLAVASQIDECLGWLAVTAGAGGVCWGCGVPALTRFGVACSECVVLVGTMVLEMWLLVEGL